MPPYTTSKRLIAGILLVSHGLMSCSNFEVPPARLEDTSTQALMPINHTALTIPSGKEEEEAVLPPLSQVSNESTIIPSSSRQASTNNPAVEGAIPADIPEGKKEINPPVTLLGKQSPSSKPRPWIQPSRGISVTSDNNNTSSNSNNQGQEATKPSNKPAVQEIDSARIELATAILANTGAEPDIRLHTYYRLLKQLDKHLQADKVLEGGWNLLWQKAQEPELLVSKEVYYKQGDKDAFVRLEKAIEEINSFKVKLASYGEASVAWQKDLDELATFYERFREKLLEAYVGVQDHLELSKLLEPKALLMWEWWPEEYYRIDQSMARYLIGKDEAGYRVEKKGEKKESTSNHQVSFLPQGSPLQAEVYFKNEGMPHLNPSREYMLYSLYKRLDIAVPASGIIVIDNIKFGEKYNEEPFFVQASTAIPGTLAKGPLKDNLKLDLDIAHFSKQVLGALLSGPVDGKADNYVLVDLPNKKQGLVSIDNDEVFQSPMKGERVHFKSVLFFLASMKEVISKGVDVLLRQLPISWLILEWLSSMQGQEERYQLLQDTLIKHGSNKHITRKGGKLASSRIADLWKELNLPFLSFSSSIIPTVSYLLTKMGGYLKERRVVTLQELFQVCYPSISLYYQVLQEKALNKPYEALRLLYDQQAPTLKELLPLNLQNDNNSKEESSEASYFQEEAPEGKPNRGELLATYKQEKGIALDPVMAYYLSLFKNGLGDIGSAIHSLQVLMNNGYEEVVDSKSAIALYVKGLSMARQAKREKEWQAIFKHLGTVNSALAWLLRLEEHFPQGWILEGKYQEAQYPQEIRGASIGRRHLPKEIEAVLLDKEGKFIADKSLSGRSMTNFYPQEKPVFYLKKFPELPAYEYGVTAFMRQLGMQEVPRSELFSFYNKQEGLYPVLLTQAIEGEPVYKVWEDDSRFSQLDPLYTGRLLVASMLLNPEDSKEDNFILSSDNKYLIPIDNDHAFLPGAIEEKGKLKVYPQLQTKTLAFCLQEMQKPLPDAVVAALTSMHIDSFLTNWIQGLVQLQSQYQHLLPVDKLASLWKEKGVCMHMPLSPLYIEGLYRKFHLLKTLLMQNPQMTPLALLKRLEPYVGSKYEQVMGLPTLKARFQAVSDVYKQTSSKGARLSIASSQRLMEIMEVPDSMLMASPVVFTKGPEAALEQLQKLYKDQRVVNSRLKDLLRGPIESTKQLDQAGERQLIRQWFESKEAYDWIMLHESQELQEKHVTSFNFQSKGHLLRALDLRGAKQLQESSFMALHNHCPNLVYLNISDWPLKRLGCFKPSGLLGSLELHPAPIFPSLQRLIVEGCKKLQEIDLALENLESLEAKDNQVLKKLRLNVPRIKYLDISGHQVSEEEQATWLKNIQFNSLPTIKGLTVKEGEIQKALARSGDEIELSYKSLNDVAIISLVNYPLFKEKKANYKEINLANNNIGASGAAGFAKNLQGTSVQTVYLSRNQIGDSGAAEFAKNLQGTSVQSVYLWYNNIGDSGAAEFAKNLQGTSVQMVFLGNNQIGASGAAEFAKNLQRTSVQTVGLNHNQIGDSGAAEFAKNLQGTSVQMVDLGSNQIGDSGAAEFAKNLQRTSVKEVYLNHNRIGDQGAAEFAKNLQGTSVKEVVLRGNKIGDSGAAEFAKNLQGTSVQTVHLSFNKIGDSGAAEFAKNLQGTSVKWVCLNDNNIGAEMQALLKKDYPHIQWNF